MAEAVAVIGLVSSIVQLVDSSTKIIERLDQFLSNVDEIPQSYRDLKTVLSLLRDMLSRTITEAERGLMNIYAQNFVSGAIEGCRLQIQQVDNILVSKVPKLDESGRKRTIKILCSVMQERKVQNIVGRIQQHMTNLIQQHAFLHTPTSSSSVKPLLFTLPFTKHLNFTGRQIEVDGIDEHFQTHDRVALTGSGGVG